MISSCEFLEKCGFFKKYQSSHDLACKGFIKQFCVGEKINQCKRKEYRQKHGTAPSDDMLPNGQILFNNINRK